MIFLEIILLFGCIIYAAKLGGIGVGMAGGLGMAIAVFVLGLKPGAIPIDVILIILSVIFAISCMQLAGGMDYMVKLASKLLRSNPKYINILAPAVTFVLTVLGIVWMSSTIIGAHIPEIKTQATALLEQYPALLAVAFFCVSALLFSQGATAALLVPVAASLGVDVSTILASFVACSALYITNIYPTTAFAIACEDTGSFMDRKWNGSWVINHPFFLPGIVGLVAAVPFGFLISKMVL